MKGKSLSFNPTSLFDIFLIKTENDEYGVDIAPAKKMLEYCTKRLDETLPANKRAERDEIIKAVTSFMIEFAESKISKN